MPASKPDTIVLRRNPDGTVVRVHPDGRTEPYEIHVPDSDVVAAMSDADIARQIASNPDAAPDMGGVPQAAWRRVGQVDVRRIRKKLGMSQETFAATFAVSVGTLRNWEQGRRRPEGVARILLTVIDREPEAVRRAIGAAR